MFLQKVTQLPERWLSALRRIRQSRFFCKRGVFLLKALATLPVKGFPRLSRYPFPFREASL
jgi:hypothetical protein